MTETIRRAERVRASELLGRGWLNTGGKDVSLEDLRGKIVILDFWTFCCINCLHVLDELRPLEQRFSDVLVTVGVHSPKFEHEADPDALAAAVERYEIAHPVLDDPNLITWQAYSARAWPTLVVIDPQGYIAANLAGEGHVAGLTSLVEELVTEHEAKGTLHRGDGPYVPPEPVSRTLRFPGKAVPVARELGGSEASQGHFLVSDTGHHRIVELDTDLQTVVRSWGGGEDHQKGHQDGASASARFNEPQGLTVLPAELAQQVGYDIVVADTVNHRLRGINAETGMVTTLAGNGVQRLLDAERARAGAVESGSLGTDPLEVSLSSPWDVLWSKTLGLVVIAMAGTHQIFTFDPTTGELSIFAGTGLEGLLDGSAETAWFAQTSGLTEDAAGDIWIADSETSSLRVIRTGAAPAGSNGADSEAAAPAVETLIGEGLFDFGFRDGAPEQARLQHPLGVTALPDGSVLMADTYNGAIRRYRGEHLAADGTTVAAGVSTVARGLKEPSDVLLDADGASLLVVETNAHELVRIAVPKEYLTVDEGATQSQRPATAVAPGEFALSIGFAAPTGQKLDDRWGDPTQLKISSSPENLLLEGAGNSEGLSRTLQLNPKVTEGVLHITARAAACDGAPGEEIPMHAACHLYQQDWGIPVTLEADAQSELTLDLRGVR